MTVTNDPSTTPWQAESAVLAGGRRWDVAAGTRAGEGAILDEDLVAIDPARAVVAVLDGFGGIGSGGRAASLAWEAIVAALEARPSAQGRPRGEAPGEVLADARGEALADARGEVLAEARSEALADALASASAGLARHQSDPRLRGAGASAVVAWLDGDRAHVAHVGTCRAHVLRRGELVTITRDHDLLRAALDGGAPEHDARVLAAAHPGVLTRWLAMEGPCDADRVERTIDDGDTLVLTTDGVHGRLAREALAAMLGGATPAVAVTRVLDAIAGADDATILVARLQP